MYNCDVEGKRYKAVKNDGVDLYLVPFNLMPSNKTRCHQVPSDLISQKSRPECKWSKNPTGEQNYED